MQSISNISSRAAISAMVFFSAAGAAFAQGSHAAPAGTLEHAVEQAHGAADHGHGPTAGVLPTAAQGIVPSLVALGVFLLVLVILSKVVWPKINSGLEQRAGKIREEIAAAEAARRQAKDALEMYEKSLAEARSEAAKMLEDARAQQQSLAAELRVQADAELSALRDRARKDIEVAKRAAVTDIYHETTRAATMMAAAILQREISPRDQQRLVEETLGGLTN